MALVGNNLYLSSSNAFYTEAVINAFKKSSAGDSTGKILRDL